MTTKGELTFSIIITAVIAIIVLMVIILIFTGKLKGTKDALDQCNGICITDSQTCNTGYQRYLIGDPGCKADKSSVGDFCCMELLPDN
jgi:hypothetical protein